MPYTPPRRVTSTPTSVTVTSPSTTPAWVQSINVGQFATIPATPSIQSVVSGYSFLINATTQCDSGWEWNDDYGPGGGMLFVGGGHTKADFPYSWIFDGLKTEDGLPGWREGQLTPQAPCTVPGLPNLYNNYAPFKWDEGSEFSTVQANMPADAWQYSPRNYWFKNQAPTIWNAPNSPYPSSSVMQYGECATQVPAGWHQYNGMYPLAPGELGVGSKGGWACSQKHSVTAMSGIWIPWGHIFDAQTRQWKRQPYRWPENTPTFKGITNNGAYGKACAFDGYAYTMLNENGVNSIVRTNLTTGVHDFLRLASNMYPHRGGFAGVPGTTIIATLKNRTPAGYLSGDKGEWVLTIIDINPALPYTSRIPTFININPLTPNPLAAPEYLGRSEPTKAHHTAQCWWIAEVGKFAAFGAQRQRNVDYGHGDWPFGIVWYTPPNPPEEGTANWFTGLWTCELESLTAVDARSQNKDYRGAGSIHNTLEDLVPSNDLGLPTGEHLQYRATWYSQKLRCFIHMPQVDTGNIFFFRSAKIP